MDDGGRGIWREVSLQDAGEEGPSSLGLERAAAGYRQGLRVGGRAVPGGRSYGTPASCTAALESNWNPLLQLPHPCPLSDIVFLPFFSPISLHFSRYCMSAAAKILLLQHILPGSKKKLQVYCQHSVIFIYTCPFCSVLLNNTFGSYSILTGE